MRHSIQTMIHDGAPVYQIDLPGSEMFYFHIYVKSGYLFVENDNFYELPHVLEHCLFEGNTSGTP